MFLRHSISSDISFGVSEFLGIFLFPLSSLTVWHQLCYSFIMLSSWSLIFVICVFSFFLGKSWKSTLKQLDPTSSIDHRVYQLLVLPFQLNDKLISFHFCGFFSFIFLSLVSHISSLIFISVSFLLALHTHFSSLSNFKVGLWFNIFSLL